jgi:hypothetical protein
MNTAASSPSEKPSNDNPPAKRGASAAAVIHIQGQTLEVIGEALIHTTGNDREGNPITFGYTSCVVREIGKVGA